jgi:hypothetical protein
MVLIQEVFDSFGVLPDILGSLKEKIEYYESYGYEFLQSWTMDGPVSPDRVRMPSGRIFDLRTIDSLSQENSECLTAGRYYGLVMGLPPEERSHYSSFYNDADMERCRNKYTSAI